MKFVSGMVMLLLALCVSGRAAPSREQLLDQSWYELRTPGFLVYSCAPTQRVAVLLGRLEHFRQAYATLTGTHTNPGSAITIMAFPDQDSLQPYLALYNGKPGNAGGFMATSFEGSLMALSLSETGSLSLHKIYHEYAHHLFRDNARLWPLWLAEGMAEIYSTFEVSPSRIAIGHPIPMHLRELSEKSMLTIESLVQVDRSSPEYNEAEPQGIFYAQSWLLTHFLMQGRNAAFRPRLSAYTRNLAAGQTGWQAFTNTFGVSLPAMDRLLADYLRLQSFQPITLPRPRNLAALPAFHVRPISKTEVYCRLGDQLRRVGRLTEAQVLFRAASYMSPAGLLPEEGLGLVAAAQHATAAALAHLTNAIARGSANPVVYFSYASERLRTVQRPGGVYTQLDPPLALELRSALRKSIQLRPDFAPGYELLGIVELIQGEDLPAAENYLHAALRLDPGNDSLLLTLAQVQITRGQPAKARSSLETLLRRNADTTLERRAQEMLRNLP